MSRHRRMWSDSYRGYVTEADVLGPDDYDPPPRTRYDPAPPAPYSGPSFDELMAGLHAAIAARAGTDRAAS